LLWMLQRDKQMPMDFKWNLKIKRKTHTVVV
jgi:hypothetical protein